jgi:GT2 family glycosyltransferase/glycosyltransferase involved in cell wall biosynthesis
MSINKLLSPGVLSVQPERLTSIESWHRHIPFAFTLLDLAKPEVLVELGTHRGDSYSAFCQGVVQQQLPTRCYAVDTWQGDEHAGEYSDEVYEDLVAWHNPRYSRFSTLLRMTFDEALAHFPDGSVDVLHIDGLHTYEAAKHDFESWLPKMSERGVVLFHDTNVRHSDFAVWQLWAELEDQYPSFEFPFGFGLGVLAIGQQVPTAVLEFLHYACEHKQEVVGWFHTQGDAAELRKAIAEIQRLQNLLNSTGEQLGHAMHVVEQRDQLVAELLEVKRALEQQLLRSDEENQQLQVVKTELHSVKQQLLRSSEENQQLRVVKAELNSVERQALEQQLLRSDEENQQLQVVKTELHSVEEQLGNTQGLFDQSLSLLAECRNGARHNTYEVQRLDAQARMVFNSRLWRMRNKLMRLLGYAERVVDYSPAALAQIPQESLVPAAILAVAPTVTIIIPVYGGFDDTRSCIESVLASTHTCSAELVVINDASPEPELVVWLNDNSERFTLLHNEHNLGFVGTVNRGMALHPHNDVVLVNSDTEVSSDWLDRLQTAAYSDARIGSVTPFSNNATICSYPIFCQDNELPEGYTPEQLDQVFAEVNAGQLVDIPTAVGFCMFIRRDCLNDAGLFDAKLFGRGYGEENEFCMRSAQRGWRHVLTGDTFVYHKGGVSFAETQSEHQRHGHKVLTRLYPHYDAVIQQHIAENPARSLRFAVDAALVRRSELPVVVIINHCRGGGTERHVLDFAQQLDGQAHVYLLKPEFENGPVYLRPFSSSKLAGLVFDPYTQMPQLLETLRWLGVVRLHYHHTIGFPQSILLLPEQLPCSYDFTVHDYYLACPQVTLADEQGRYCGAPDEAGCNACLAKRPGPDNQSITQWRQFGAQLLNGAERVFVPSYDTLTRMQGYFPEADFILAVHEPALQPVLVTLPELQVDEPLRILALGALSVFKGADVLEACALQARAQRAPLQFHLLGYAYRSLRTKPFSHLQVHGSYDDAELARLIAEIDPHVVWFPGSCPETYSYTLSAVLEAGLPVIATDIGAFPERLAEREWTWLVQPDRSTDEIISHFLVVKQMLEKKATPQPTLIQTDAIADFNYAADYTVTLESPRFELDKQFDLHSAWAMLPNIQSAVAFADVQSPLIRKALPAILHNQWLGPLIARLPHNFKQSIKERLRR